MIGAAFGAVVTALVASFITPLVAAIGGKPDFSALAFTINGSRFTYGAFLNALISFLILAAVVFFLIVRPLNALMDAHAHGGAGGRGDRARARSACRRSPSEARRCAFCTAEVGTA